MALLILGCTPEVTPPRESKLSVDDADLTRVGAPRPSPAGPIVAAPNRAPVVKMFAISPGKPTLADLIHAEAEASDPEGATPDVEYAWFVNGDEVIGVSGPELGADHFGVGDKVHAKVVVDDGELKAEAVTPDVTVQNRSPVIKTLPSQVSRFEGVRLRAEDPDDDALTWSVSGGPDGLTVSDEGVLHYVGSEEEPGGEYTVAIRVDDPHGGWGRMDVPLKVSPGSKAPK